MAQKIDQDAARFKEIVRGRVKKELRKFISHDELIGKKGKDLVSIPIQRIDIPHFIYGDNQKGGVGQGEGGEGEATEQPGEGAQSAGNAPGEHLMEVEVSFQELAELLGEELELPKIEPKGQEQLDSKAVKYTGVAPAGPQSLKHFKRTFKRSLRRQIMSGSYNPQDPVIVPVRQDWLYRTWKDTVKQKSQALIVYMLDVSGSMGNEQKEIVRLEAFWIDTWIRSQYDNVVVKYIIHDAIAREVEQETFYKTRESGGTIISSAYKLLLKMIDEQYNPSEWNIYPFQFSDGDNWSGNDTEDCLRMLHERILPMVNIFCYGQVESEYGSGQFLQDLEARFKADERLITSKIPNRDAILGSIKTFLGKGK